MKVCEAMSTEIVAVKQDDSVKSLVAKMVVHNVSQVSVMDDAGALIGVVTVRDVMLPLYPGQGDYVHDTLHARDFEMMEEGYDEVMKKSVGSIMTSNPVSVEPTDSVLKAASFMGLRNLRRIPVVEGNKQVGVLTLENINNALFIARA
ncbi:MAG: CBS domain-containing protein [Zetaproteobacteria bacterium]|nr:CBS domain-containing protein [Zetaproteobacteria bacterium]